jgi:hypothetical protein
VNSVMNLRVAQNAGKLPRGLTTGGISSSAQLHRVSFLVLRKESGNIYLGSYSEKS